MEVSFNLAGIIGPVLILLAITEYKNFGICSKDEPTLVYLNGILLFIGGLAIIRAHNRWMLDWPITITIVGWLALLLGVYRTFFPNAKQIESDPYANIIFLIFFVMGAFLTLQAYFL